MRQLPNSAVLAAVLTANAAAAADDAPPPSSYKAVESGDLAVSPKKFAGKKIRVLGARCYYADAQDYRCILPDSAPMVSVFTKAISNGDAASFIQKDCDVLRVALTSAKCRVAIIFQYTQDQIKEDLVSGFNQRIVLHPDDAEAYWVEGVRPGQRRR